MKRVNLQNVKDEIFESFPSCSTELYEQGSTSCGRAFVDCVLQEQSDEDGPINSSRQFGAKEVTGGDGMTCCVMCCKSFPSVVTLADHISMVHNKTGTTVASQLWAGEQTFINYYDLKPKIEIEENGVKVERELIFSPEKSNVTYSTHNKDINIKSEECLQLIIECKREEYALQNVVKKEQQSDAANTREADQHGPSALVQIQTDAAPLQTIMKTERDSKEEIMITLEASVNPSLETREELTEEGAHATVSVISSCLKKYTSEGTGKQSLAGYSKNYCREQKFSLDEDIRKRSSEKRFACNICDYKCNVISRLKTHIRTHTGEKPFACHMCDYKCSVKSSLRKHIFTHTGEKPLACNVCSYKCRKNSSLVNHFRVHTGEKPFACKTCDYKCSDKSSLKKHIRIHTGEKPFACKMCDYRCSVKSGLKTHTRTHTGEKPFICKICDYKCSVKNRLIIHIRTHTGEKPFACNVCHYKCSQKSSLEKHTKLHTGEKPFACDMCGYTSRWKGSLKKHITTHTGLKPFACDTCEYKCTDRSRLLTHIRTHTGEKPFACDMCDYKCNQKSSLTRHVKTHTGRKY